MRSSRIWLKPTRQHQVLENETHVQPPKQSDRVEAGQVRAGGRVGWTALIGVVESKINCHSYLIKNV